MGSRRRWEVTREQLAETGIPSKDMDRIHNPIGVDIAAETVEEIAVSIMSEVIAAVNEDS
jgi:xanthine dehydrogenase accessory factor